jgi:1-acyl-sn-glycerol-3-phosphate acyltransferase
MLFIRSLIFNIAFILFSAIWFIWAIPGVFFTRPGFMRYYARPWFRMCRWLHSTICNVRVEFRGRENLPQGLKTYMVASKHQSAWETTALAWSVPRPRYILKKQLMYVPLFGLYLWRMGQIPVNRGDRAAAIAALNQAADFAAIEGGQLLIYPEGTRRPVGAPPNYKQGIAHLYERLNVPVVPVAHNAGVVWPRRGFIKYPGLIVMEFLPPIAPGMPKEEFHKKLQEMIETATNRLVAEAEADPAFRAAGGRPSTPASQA